jgi:hypothetical protein
MLLRSTEILIHKSSGLYWSLIWNDISRRNSFLSEFPEGILIRLIWPTLLYLLVLFFPLFQCNMCLILYPVAIFNLIFFKDHIFRILISEHK